MNIILRAYQEYCKKRFFDAVSAGIKNICIAIKTGTGKTFTSAAIAKEYLDKGEVIIFIAPRINLVLQTVKSYMGLGRVQIIQGSRKFDNSGKIYVASLQTLIRRNLPFKPALIIMDEKHNGHTGKSHKKVMEKFPDATFLSLTATPFDAKGQPLKGFGEIIEYKTTQWFIDNDYLVDCECYAPVIPDLSGVKVTGGDYNEGQLDGIMNNKIMIGNIVEETKDKIIGKKTLFFAVTIDHAEKVAQKYRDEGFVAHAYHSNLKNDHREQLLEDFESNKIDILVSVSALVMGFDVPSVNCMIIARPTKSQSFFRQLIGRGMRPFDGKTMCILIDCAGTIKENGYPNDEIVPKVKKKKLKKIMKCNICGKKAVQISKSIRRIQGVIHYVTTWACSNNHTFEVLKEAKGTVCPMCSLVLIPGRAEFKETTDEYIVYTTCDCGEEITIRTIPKIDGKLARMQVTRTTKLDLVRKIGSLTKDDQKELIERYLKYIMEIIHPDMQEQCLSSVYVSLDMELSNKEIGDNLQQSVVDASLKVNYYKCLNQNLFERAFHQTTDPANIIAMYNSRSVNPMKERFMNQTILKLKNFQEDYPKSEEWLLKSIKTRCKNIRQNNQKMASIFYFIDFLRKKEESKINN